MIKNGKPNVVVGRGNPVFLIISFFFNIKYVHFCDTEHVNYSNFLSKTFANVIITPSCFNHDFGKKQIRLDTYKELWYLHPNRFTPNPEVLKEIGLTEQDKFFVVRFVSWEASHDIGQKGLSIEDKRKLIEALKPHGKIIISSEKELPAEFEEYRMKICPTKMHDLLYYATMYVGESGTMATESSLLGTPSILITPLAKFCGNHISLNKAELQYYFDDIKSAMYEIEKKLTKKNLKEKTREKRDEFLNSKIDITKFLIDLINERT